VDELLTQQQGGHRWRTDHQSVGGRYFDARVGGGRRVQVRVGGHLEHVGQAVQVAFGHLFEVAGIDLRTERRG